MTPRLLRGRVLFPVVLRLLMTLVLVLVWVRLRWLLVLMVWVRLCRLIRLWVLTRLDWVVPLRMVRTRLVRCCTRRCVVVLVGCLRIRRLLS